MNIIQNIIIRITNPSKHKELSVVRTSLRDIPPQYQNDEDFIFDVLDRNLYQVKKLEFNQTNKKIVLKIIDQLIIEGLFSYLPTEFKKDREIIFTIFERQNELQKDIFNRIRGIRKIDYFDLSNELRNDKEFIKSLVKLMNFTKVDKTLEWWGDLELVRKIIKHHPEVYSDIPNFQDDPEIIEYASYSVKNYQFLPEEYRKNKRRIQEFVQDQKRVSSSMIEVIPEEILRTKFFAKLLAEYEPRLLDKYSQQYKLNKSIAVIVVKNHSNFNEFLDPSFLEDMDIIRTALRSNSLYYMNLPILKNSEIVKELINEFPELYRWADKNINHDKSIALKVIKKDMDMAKYLPDCLSDDKDIFTYLIKKDASYIIYAKSKGKVASDKKIALIGLQKNNVIYKFLTKELMEDKDIILAATKNKDKSDMDILLSYLPKETLEIKEIRELVFKYNSSIFQYLPKKNRDDVGYMIEALEKDSYMWAYVSDEIKADRDILKTLILKVPKLLAKIHHQMPDDIDFLMEIEPVLRKEQNKYIYQLDLIDRFKRANSLSEELKEIDKQVEKPKIDRQKRKL